MNRFDTLDLLLTNADSSEILHQLIFNMSNTEAILSLDQVAIDLGIDNETEDKWDEDNLGFKEYDDFED